MKTKRLPAHQRPPAASQLIICLHESYQLIYKFEIFAGTRYVKVTHASYSSDVKKVKVYKGGTKVKEFSVPKKKAGTLWSVFSIDASGNIKTINKMSYESEAEQVGA